MRLKDFAKTGRKVSEIGVGTYYDPAWIAGGFMGWRRGSASKVEAVRAGLGAGVTLVDTAEIYKSEPLVAEAIRGSKRDEIFLATKVSPSHLHRDALLKSFEGSLRRLGTSYIDLYQVHFPNSNVPIQETMGAMEELVRGGKLLHVGISNYSLKQMEEARAALPKTELSAVQLDYSLIHRDVERDILPYCDREGIALLAYFPLGHGKLVSNPKLDKVAGAHGKTRAQVALRWLAQKPNVFPIPRASSSAHVLENVGGSDWDLSPDDTANLDATFQ
jgi:diketogulonate reductase-like aldo/keto reductase